MKSNIPSRQLDRKAMREIAKEELRKQKQEFCPVCQAQMENQTIAVLCMALHNVYGFGKARLERLLLSAQGLADYINGKHPEESGKANYTPEIAVEWLKDIGIDLEKIK